MAGKSDGSIIIDSKIDTSGFTEGEVNMKSSFGKIASAAGKMGAAIKSAFTVKSKGADGLEEKSEEIKISVDDTAKSVEDGMQRINEAMSSGESATAFDTIGEKVENLKNELKYLQEIKGISFGDERFDTLYQQLILAEDELKQYKAALTEAARAERDTAQAGQEASQYVSAFQSVLMAFSAMAHAPVSTMHALKNSIQQLPSAMADLTSNLKKSAVAMLGLHKNSKKLNGSMGSGLKTILKYGLGIRSLYVLFNKVRNAIKEGFKNLAQYSDEVNSSLSALKSSITQLKNSLATAFAPILTVIAPILTRFINLLSQATTYVGMFFAALTGKKSFNKAVAVQEDYASSLGDTADNAKEALRYLSGLDEIRTFTKDKEDSGGYQGPTTEEMFEEVEIPSFINDWVNEFKKAWENADFTEIGTIVGTKLKNALDGINWDNIYQTAKNFGKGLATFLNGLISPEFFGSIGKTIASALNTAIYAVLSFGKNFDFENLGRSIASGINNFFETFDFEALAQTTNLWIKGALTAAATLLKETDFELIGNKIGEFISSIDWIGILDGLGDLIWEGIQSAVDLWKGVFNTAPIETTIISALAIAKFTGLGNALSTSISSALATQGITLGTLVITIAASAITWKIGFDLGKELGKILFPEDAYWYDTFTWFGEGGFFDTILSASAEELLDALGNTIVDIGNALAKNLFNWDTTLELFDGAAYFFQKIANDFEDKNWGAIGEDIISGIVVGFTGAISFITEPFTDLFQWIWDGICGIFGIHSPSKEMEPIGENILLGIIEGFSNKVSEFSNAIRDWWEESVAPWFTKEKWEELGNNVKSTLTEKFDSIKGSLIDIWEKLKTKTSEIWGKIKDAIKTPINAIIGFINKLISGIVSGINSLINALNSFKIDVPSWVTDLTGIKSFGFNLSTITAPQIPYLATGAVIPPNAPFMAVLGDQKRGNNIEAPENLLRKIVREESGNNGVGIKEIRIPLIVSGRQMLEVILTEAQLVQMANGKNPFEMA